MLIKVKRPKESYINEIKTLENLLEYTKDKKEIKKINNKIKHLNNKIN